MSRGARAAIGSALATDLSDGVAMTTVRQRIASREERPCVVARGAGRHTGLPLPGMPQLQVDMS
jgi:hypothetical protein